MTNGLKVLLHCSTVASFHSITVRKRQHQSQQPQQPAAASTYFLSLHADCAINCQTLSATHDDTHGWTPVVRESVGWRRHRPTQCCRRSLMSHSGISTLACVYIYIFSWFTSDKRQRQTRTDPRTHKAIK